MVSRRKRAMAVDILASPERRPSPSNPPSQSLVEGTLLGYEKFRDERIKENLERMQKLGIIDLSLKLKSSSSPRTRSPSDSKGKYKVQALPPPRRSSRLQNASPVSYAEICIKKVERSVRNGSALVEEGQKEEVYTDEHTKLLGSCEMSWTLFVDGYDNDGRRIYDQIKGKTCHQCRQKTLGHHTHCSKCALVQGQFCGDCLYMRYGENVLEVENNPNWICPVCRGICNCSLCRTKKGWAPTGSLYRKVLSLGFKSVAHYLIQTRRCLANSGDQISAQPATSKKSLLFSGTEDPSHPINTLESKNGLNSESTDKNSNDAQKKSLPFTDTEDPSHSKKSLQSVNGLNLDSYEKNSTGCNGKSGSHYADEHTAGNIARESFVEPKNKSKKAKEPAVVKPSPDCIAGRLRSRGNKP